MLIPNIVVSEYTSCLTCVLLENRSGYCFRAIIKTSAIARPTSIDVTVATTTENFAVLGRAAPSSFDTLTLQKSFCYSNALLCWLIVEAVRSMN